MMSKVGWWGPLGVLAVACLVALAVSLPQAAYPASAAGPAKVFDVDSFADEADHSANGECSAGQVTGGPCTLRAAVMETRGYLEQERDVVIRLPVGTYRLSLAPGSSSVDEKAGDLDLKGLTVATQATVTIESAGPGAAVIDADGIDRVLEIGPHHNVILRNLEMRNGRTPGTEREEAGGGILAEGANLRLENVRLIGNEARASGTDGSFGGGLYLRDGDLIMVQCEVSGNRAAYGSALDIWDTNAGQDKYYAVIHQSAIHDNESVVSNGAAIYANARLFLVNSTVAGNRSSSSAGGNVAVHAQARAWIHNSTLQTAGVGWNLRCAFKPCQVRNSALVTTAGAENCSATGGGSVVSAGGNVFDDSSCNTNTGLGDLEISRDSWGLSPFNGSYFLPGLGSPVVDRLAGPCRGFLSFDGTSILEGDITVDQRGEPRDDGRCDAGAIELEIMRSYLPLAVR